MIAVKRTVPAFADRRHDVEALLVELSVTNRSGNAVDRAVTLLGNVGEAGDVDSSEILFGDEVDHPADCIGAINCRSAVLEHFDTLNRRERDLVHVNCRALEPVGGNSPTVEQN